MSSRMEDILIVLLLLSTGIVVYNASYRLLWCKISSLFDFIPNPSVKTSSSLTTADYLKQSNSNAFFHKFYTAYSVSSNKIQDAIRVLFSLAMVCYAITIEIILWQIKTADAQQNADIVTTWVWPFISFALSLLLILIQPFLIIICLLDKFFNDKFDVDRLIILTIGTLFILIAVLTTLNFGPFQYTENILTKLSIAGVSILATLSGIASVSTLYYTALMFWNRKDSKIQHINSTKNNKSLIWASDLFIKDEIADYQKNIETNISILQRLDAEPAGPNPVLRNQLIEKIGWYQLELGKLESQVRQPEHIRILKKCVHLTFLIYCLHKVVVTFTKRLPHIIHHAWKYPKDQQYEYFDKLGTTSVSSDPLAVTFANILDFIFFHFNHQQELDSLTKQISLILSTSLFIGSLSTVVTTISYLSALLPMKIQILAMFAMQNGDNSSTLPISSSSSSKKNAYKRAPSLIKNLFVSELTGIYVVATMLTIRSNLPFDVSEKLNELIGERFSVPNAVIDSWFYEVFAISCFMTLLFIKMVERTVVKA